MRHVTMLGLLLLVLPLAGCGRSSEEPPAPARPTAIATAGAVTPQPAVETTAATAGPPPTRTPPPPSLTPRPRPPLTPPSS